MKKKIICGSLLVMLCVLFTGCGNAIPELSEEEESKIVNYAADIVLKYDSNHVVKLQEPALEPEKESSEDPERPKETAAENEPEEASEPDAEVIDNTNENDEPSVVTIDDFMQLNGFAFSYEGYEVDDAYPKEDTETYFAMGSTEGHKLLVLKFKAQNISGAETSLDMIDTGIRFKVQVNGDTQNALVTMLLNDFANYQGMIGAGESEELVVIREIPEAQANNITSLNLIMKNGDKTATIAMD